MGALRPSSDAVYVTRGGECRHFSCLRVLAPSSSSLPTTNDQLELRRDSLSPYIHTYIHILSTSTSTMNGQATTTQPPDRDAYGGGESPSSLQIEVISRHYQRLRQVFQSTLDRSTPQTGVRWLVWAGSMLLYLLRVFYLVEGFYIVRRDGRGARVDFHGPLAFAHALTVALCTIYYLLFTVRYSLFTIHCRLRTRW